MKSQSPGLFAGIVESTRRSNVASFFILSCLGAVFFLVVFQSTLGDETRHNKESLLSRKLDFEAYGFVSDIVNGTYSMLHGEETAVVERTRHAILVPYRDRAFHLQVFKKHMSDYFQKYFPNTDFDLWIVEQDDRGPFNRAWLGNVGFAEAMKFAPDVDCIILHDVDLIPDIDIGYAVPFHNCTWPTRLANELEQFDWRTPYPNSAGGVTGVSVDHYLQINGLSNLYFGWGGEDDDFFLRLRTNNLLRRTRRWDHQFEEGFIMAPPRLHGTFRTISEGTAHHPVKRKREPTAEKFVWNRLKMMKMDGTVDSMIWKEDGVNTLSYLLNESNNKTVHLENPIEELPGLASFHHIYVQWDRSKDDVTMKTYDATVNYNPNAPPKKISPAGPPRQTIREKNTIKLQKSLDAENKMIKEPNSLEAETAMEKQQERLDASKKKILYEKQHLDKRQERLDAEIKRYGSLNDAHKGTSRTKQQERMDADMNRIKERQKFLEKEMNIITEQQERLDAAKTEKATTTRKSAPAVPQPTFRERPMMEQQPEEHLDAEKELIHQQQRLDAEMNRIQQQQERLNAEMIMIKQQKHTLDAKQKETEIKKSSPPWAVPRQTLRGENIKEQQQRRLGAETSAKESSPAASVQLLRQFISEESMTKEQERLDAEQKSPAAVPSSLQAIRQKNIMDQQQRFDAEKVAR